jgi:ERCC4-type nuclease
MHTAEICRDLKKNLPGASKDPDLLKIEKIGKVGSIDLDGEADQAEEGEFNRLMPREFLKRVPGVTSNNINVIMKSVKNIIELVRLPEDNLKELVGPKSAKLIKNFFETKVGGGIHGDSDEEEAEEIP